MEPGQQTQPPRIEQLRDLVRTYRVCYEASPEYSAYTGKIKAVGFDVELYATHHDLPKAPTAGCPECAPLERALREIADFVLPKERRPSRYEVHGSRGIEYSARRGKRPDIKLTIIVEHSEGINDPIDACEIRCRDEIVANLKALHASEGQWRER